MYFTDTLSLNSVEAIMKRPPGQRQRGGGRKHQSCSYTKKDCNCRLCLYYRKRVAARFRFALCWTSVWNAVLSL